MKSSIVFFDNLENSKRGFLRGLVIFPIFILITLVWLFFSKTLYKKHIDTVSKYRLWFSLCIISLLTVSAIGVHTPNTLKKAVVFSALVGFVVYGITNSTMLMVTKKWNYSIFLIDILWGIFSTSLLGYILYIIVNKWPKIFAFV